MGKLLDFDPLTNTKTTFHYDNGMAIIESVQDIEPIIEMNKLGADQLDKKQNMWYVGSIDMQTCLRFAQESNTKLWSREWSEYVKKQLNLPDYRKFNQNKIKL